MKSESLEIQTLMRGVMQIQRRSKISFVDVVMVRMSYQQLTDLSSLLKMGSKFQPFFFNSDPFWG